MRARISRCTRERGITGVIVAVDFYERTAVIKVAREPQLPALTCATI